MRLPRKDQNATESLSKVAVHGGIKSNSRFRTRLFANRAVAMVRLNFPRKTWREKHDFSIGYWQLAKQTWKQMRCRMTSR